MAFVAPNILSVINIDRRSMTKQQINYSNYQNTIQILNDLRRERREERYAGPGPTGVLGKADTSIVGFMNADKNKQLAFADAEGMFPDNELDYFRPLA